MANLLGADFRATAAAERFEADSTAARLALEQFLASGRATTPALRVRALTHLVTLAERERATVPERFVHRLQQLASAQAEANDPKAAAKSLERLLGFSQGANISGVDPLHTRLDLAEAYSLADQNDLAQSILSQVFRSGDRSLQGVAKIRLGDIYYRLGNTSLGTQLLEQGVDETKHTALDAVHIGLLRFRATLKLAHHFLALPGEETQKGVSYTNLALITANGWLNRHSGALSAAQQHDVRIETVAVLSHCATTLEQAGNVGEARRFAAEAMAMGGFSEDLAS